MFLLLFYVFGCLYCFIFISISFVVSSCCLTNLSHSFLIEFIFVSRVCLLIVASNLLWFQGNSLILLWLFSGTILGVLSLFYNLIS